MKKFEQLIHHSVYLSGIITNSNDDPPASKSKVKQTFPRSAYSSRVQGNLYRAGASRGYVNRADVLRVGAKEGSFSLFSDSSILMFFFIKQLRTIVPI